MQRADLLGNVFNQLPVLGAIRMQMLKAARREREKARMAMATERIVTQFLAEEMATHAQITKRIRPLTAPN